MDIYPFKTLYFADLNAIQNLENNSVSHIKNIEQVRLAFPNVNIWVDAGINTIDKAKKWSTTQTQTILGSESFSTIEQYQELTSELNTPFTLSLDFTTQGYKGPKTLLQDSEYWPNNVIVMTLAKVGANTGVDTKTIQTVLAKKRGHTIYAAGGIRNSNDISQLQNLGVNGCLLASALHNKQIVKQDLESLKL